MHNDNVAAYALRWFEGVAAPDRIERAFAWYSRYMSRFLDKYDAVVTNGPALEKRLRARGNHVPVIVLTANASLDGRVKGLNEGADDYLAKPFQIEELEARIRVQLSAGHSKDQVTQAIDAFTRVGKKLGVV